MRLLSFIAALFYLSLLSPSAGYSASSSWVDVRESNKISHHALVSAATSSHQATDSTENSSDPDKTLALWRSFEFPSGSAVCPQSAENPVFTAQVRPYASRAPPVDLV
ncbi:MULTISPECIES: hypothetical protein [Rheinheimera]|uniref:Secreted protein n=1 Tax=Rheinheimera marina TaxID=1774958 RepID=A0ABV9JHG8_9GAMM